MKKEDHERIAEWAVSNNSCDIDPNIITQLKEGSIWPDKVHRKRAHHTNRKEDITRYILRARKYYLQNDYSKSAFCLGVAFHYIADGMCPGSKNPKHNSWELAISRLPLPKKLLISSYDTPNYLFKNIEYELGIKRRTENSSFSTALTLCSYVIELVWKPIPQKNEQEEQLVEITKSKLPRKSTYISAIFLMLVSLGINILVAYIFGISQILFAIPITLLLSSIPFQKLYNKIQALMWVLDWYGIHY